MLSSYQSAAYLGLTRAQFTYRVYIRRDLRPSGRVGHHLLFDRATLDAWRAAQPRAPWKRGETRWWLKNQRVADDV